MKTFFISLNAKGIGAIDRHPHDASDEKGLTLCDQQQQGHARRRGM